MAVCSLPFNTVLMDSIAYVLLFVSILLFIIIIAGRTSYRFGVPTLIFFVIVGMLAGSEGIGGINFNNPKTAQFIGIIAFNFILYSGGLGTDYKAIKPILWQGIILSTLGVLITAFSLGAFIHYITDFSIYESLLLGSIVSSTDAASVFSILRSKSIALKYNLRPMLEMESGSNDPMANVLTVIFTGLVINENESLLSAVPFFFKQIIIGAIMGYLLGMLSKITINKIKLELEGLSPVLVITLMLFTFSITDLFGGNGFLAVYLSGVYLGNQHIIHKNTIIKAFNGYSWLMQIILFLTLGLLVIPSHMLPIVGIGLLISIFLILIARPISVFISLLFFPIKRQSKLFISWVGLRGAVPIVFATYPLVAGIEKANMIFNIVFFVSLTSVLIQGTTLSTIARWLKLTLPGNLKSRRPADIILSDNFESELFEITIAKDISSIGMRIVDLKFPRNTLITLIEREGKYITPNGSTKLAPMDKLIILMENNDSIPEIFDRLGMKQ